MGQQCVWIPMTCLFSSRYCWLISCCFHKLQSQRQFIVGSARIFKQSMTGVMIHPGQPWNPCRVPMNPQNLSCPVPEDILLSELVEGNILQRTASTVGSETMISCNMFLQSIWPPEKPVPGLAKECRWCPPLQSPCRCPPGPSGEPSSHNGDPAEGRVRRWNEIQWWDTIGGFFGSETGMSNGNFMIFMGDFNDETLDMAPIFFGWSICHLLSCELPHWFGTLLAGKMRKKTLDLGMSIVDKPQWRFEMNQGCLKPGFPLWRGIVECLMVHLGWSSNFWLSSLGPFD